MINNLLHPLLTLPGWEVYLLVGLLVAAEASIMLGFIFPGETAVILGGVVASKGRVSLTDMAIVVVGCAIVGDSIGYWVGDKWGDKILRLPLLRKRQRGVNTALEQLRKRGALFVFVGRFTAFFRAVIPGLAGLSKMRYRVFLPANAAGGLCWGVLFLLLGYFVGQAIERAAGIASYVLLGIIVLFVVVLFIRHRVREKRIIGNAEESAEDINELSGKND
ncbi:MAG TPA: DedA family protein [Acidimicrobiales bacterium]|nr:DedA family protein [Acidimicrobiales bacterium]